MYCRIMISYLKQGYSEWKRGGREISTSVNSMFMYQYSTKIHTGIMREESADKTVDTTDGSHSCGLAVLAFKYVS